METKLTTTLPEELVSKHREIFNTKYINKPESATLLTLDYMGRLLECSKDILINDEVWRQMMNGFWFKDNSESGTTTSQLIELFFNQQSK